MDTKQLVELIKVKLDEGESIALLDAVRPIITAPIMATPDEPRKRTAKTGIVRSRAGSKGIYVAVFVKAWHEGKLALSTTEFRERARHIKYFATDKDADLALGKTKKKYKRNSDGTWSLVTPPKPMIVDAAE